MAKRKKVVARQESEKRNDKNDNPAGVLDRTLHLFSSVRFGIILLVLLLICCAVGMVVMQQNVSGFQDYYEQLTPAQRELYGKLGVFDIYHSWYFTTLLAITALNIVLSSIDRFPAAWSYFRGPKLSASPAFVRAQMFARITESDLSPDELADQVETAWRASGFRPRVTREDGRVTVFAQRNLWNRLGAYAVHLALLMIFVGGFLTSRYGVGGMMEIVPGNSSDAFLTYDSGAEEETAARARLPFTVECTDLQQRLVRPEGGLNAMNTIDWLSYVKIKDGDRQVDALIHLNEPFDYRGYRFFQSSFQPRGNARQITLTFTPAQGGPVNEVTIARGGSADLPGIGSIEYVGFYPDVAFEKGQAFSQSDDYSNPAAELRVTTPEGKVFKAFALADSTAQPASERDATAPVIVLKSFEKVATSHTLSVQYDPGRTPVYIGFTLLAVALCGVFFFSHRRLWAVIEPGRTGSTLHIAGNTNRNRPAFESQFNALANFAIQGATGGTK
ncbi:MAG TPA: cytochrome c biogenesis protein ResB [Blastocatellia bacterium]|nr:cytochrome c biogenesis protein ResB [Blastocatellia bacterium]